MDDPWGSPWADETPRPLPKSDELGARGPVTPGKPFGLNKTSSSPWDDDDGFGEWAALPATDNLQASEQDGLEEAEAVGGVASVNDGFAQEKDHIRPDGSTWFSREISATTGYSDLEIPEKIAKDF